VNEIGIFKRIGHVAWIAIRFVLFGCSGFLALLYGSVGVFMFMERIIHPDCPNPMSPFLPFPLLVSGAFLMLYGTGQWNRWAYLWVFVSIPISLSISFFFPGDKATPAVIVGIVAFAVNSAVHKYYLRKSSPHTHYRESANPSDSTL
jgi:hypothetical protein